MKIYDVTLPIQNNMLVWRDDLNISVKQIATLEKDGSVVSWLSMSSHTGTHVDAPSHFLEDATGVDRIDPHKLLGPCMVLDFTGLDHSEIMAQDLEKFSLEEGSRIFFKTGNFKFLKQEVFPDKYISLSEDGAKYLVERKVYLVGIDFLGIEKENAPGHPVHKTLLSAGIVNLEGLDLSEVPANEYRLICMPLRIANCDGAPARVFLIQD